MKLPTSDFFSRIVPHDATVGVYPMAQRLQPAHSHEFGSHLENQRPILWND